MALSGDDGRAFDWVALACGIGSALTFAVLAWAFLGEALASQAIVGALLVLLAGIGVVVLEPTAQGVSEVVAGVGSWEP